MLSCEKVQIFSICPCSSWDERDVRESVQLHVQFGGAQDGLDPLIIHIHSPQPQSFVWPLSQLMKESKQSVDSNWIQAATVMGSHMNAFQMASKFIMQPIKMMLYSSLSKITQFLITCSRSAFLLSPQFNDPVCLKSPDAGYSHSVFWKCECGFFGLNHLTRLSVLSICPLYKHLRLFKQKNHKWFTLSSSLYCIFVVQKYLSVCLQTRNTCFPLIHIRSREHLGTSWMLCPLALSVVF